MISWFGVTRQQPCWDEYKVCFGIIEIGFLQDLMGSAFAILSRYFAACAIGGIAPSHIFEYFK
jgi:hypothetical protein